VRPHWKVCRPAASATTCRDALVDHHCGMLLAVYGEMRTSDSGHLALRLVSIKVRNSLLRPPQPLSTSVSGSYLQSDRVQVAGRVENVNGEWKVSMVAVLGCWLAAVSLRSPPRGQRATWDDTVMSVMTSSTPGRPRWPRSRTPLWLCLQDRRADGGCQYDN
jgi:hypothetical protein